MTDEYFIIGAAVLGVLVVVALLWPRQRRWRHETGAFSEFALHLHVGLDDAHRLLRPARNEGNGEDCSVAGEDEGVDEAATKDASGAKSRRFVVDSLTLLTCFRYLFGEASTGDWPGRFREVFGYLSCVRVRDDTYILTNLLPVRFSEQTAGGVTVDQTSNIETFTALDRLGLTLGAHVHSHPGQSGPQSTFPSETDRKFQGRLEQGGCPAIGLIFARSRDGYGYVRFFGCEKSPVEVEIQGAFVERMEDYVFRLCLDNGQLPINTVVVS